MNSVLSEIVRLRKGEPFMIDYENSNRYRLIGVENNGTRTAYCFGVPVYNSQTRKMVDLRFRQDPQRSNVFYTDGSSARITLAQDILLEGSETTCRVSLTDGIFHPEGRGLKCGPFEIFPTTNGVLCKAECSWGQTREFTLTVGRAFMNVRANDRYFALMSEEYRPFVTVSCLGAADNGGRILSPASIGYRKDNDQKYTLQISPQSPAGKYVLYEINLHEPKLFQDTTVESKNPQVNNAFGGTAFLGNTAFYGEQWLYLRPDFSRIPEMLDKRIVRAILHFPKFDANGVSLSAFRVAGRFCSFGSNWDNKIAMAESIADSTAVAGYQSIDVTRLVTDAKTKYLTRSEGLILKTRAKGSGFTAIATGDSYYAPPVFEINFR